MSNNLAFAADNEKLIASDEIAGVHYQLIKLAFGAEDVAVGVSGTNPLPVKAPGTTNSEFGTVTVGTGGDLIRSSNPGRTSLVIQNLGSADLFVGNGSVTTSTGLKIIAGEKYSFDPCYQGVVEGIVVSGSADVRFFEVG